MELFKQQVKMDSVKKNLGCVALIFQFFAQQYFSVKSVTETNQKLMPNVGYTIYFFVCFVFLTGQMIYTVTLADDADGDVELSAKTFLTIAVQQSIFVGLILIIFIGLIHSYIKTPLLKKFYLNCFEMSAMCKENFQYVVDFKPVRNSTIKRYAIVLSIFIVLEVIMYGHAVFFSNEQSPFLKIFLGILPFVFLGTLVARFVFMIELVNYLLRVFREILSSAFEKKMQIGNIHDAILRSDNLKREHLKTMKLRNLKKFYFLISENADLINEISGATILTITAVMVIAITSSIYNLFLTVLGKLPAEQTSGKWMVPRWMDAN